MVDLRFCWLGPPEILIDGRPLRLEMRKSLALLAYLSLCQQKPTRETLATLFWAEYDQPHALSNLRRNLSSVSGSMPAGILEADRERIGLVRKDWLTIDVEEFRAHLASIHQHAHPPEQVCVDCAASLERAAAAYRGHFFEGFNLKDCPEFDEWQFFQREGLKTEYGEALHKLAAFYQQQHQWEKAILRARAWLALDPLHEPAHRLLMELYFQSDQRSAAIRQYEECERAIKQELDQPPELETRNFYEKILKGSALEIAHPVRPATSAAQPVIPLLKTKLFIPRLPPAMVSRPRLVTLLNEGVKHPLTILTAPAGFGKSTLLAEWVAQSKLPVAWIGLDRQDNDPFRLLAYLLAAMRGVLPDPSAGAEALELLHSPSALPAAAILSSFINDLTRLAEPVALVLDDYHNLREKAAHEVINFLLEHQPACLRLILSTRVDPPFSLARMRANHQLYEIRSDDLRFSRQEAAIFLNQMVGLAISEEDIAILDERTEGWIAGVKLVSIALQPSGPGAKAQNSHEFILSLKGSHRFILDYLVEEVLNSQTAFIRKFLFRTSLLDRFCAGLCEAVVGQQEDVAALAGRVDPPAAEYGSLSSQQILEYLDHAHLFLIPLDDDRCWYRYHHLFADLLRARLEQIEGEENTRALHRRAADWLEQHSLPIEALGHAFAAQNYDQTARLVESNYLNAWERNELDSINAWMRGLPEEFVLKRPKLCIFHAFLEMLRGRLAGLERFVENAEIGLSQGLISSEQENEEMHGLLNIIKAYLAGSRGDWPLAIELARQPLSPFPRYSPAVNNLLGLAFFMEGQFEPAKAAWRKSILDDVFYYAGAIALATASMGRLLKIEGRLNEFEKLFQETLQTIAARGPARFYMPALVDFGMADLLRERNDLDGALEHIQQGIAACQSWFPANSMASCYAVLVRVLAAKGDYAAAIDAYQDITHKLKGESFFSHNQSELDTSQVHAWLAKGDLASAAAWLSDHEAWLAIPDEERPGISFRSEIYRVYTLRILLAQGKFEEALTLSARMLEIAGAGARSGRVVEIEMLQALALRGLGRPAEALQALGRSLAFACPQGYLRMFLDEGAPLADLLHKGKTQGAWHEPGLDTYVDQLLTLFSPIP